MRKIIEDIKENLVDYIFSIVFIVSFLSIFVLIFAAIYDAIYIKDEVKCLGGHYELRYNNATKTNMPHFVCDSAKIIYK